MVCQGTTYRNRDSCPGPDYHGNYQREGEWPSAVRPTPLQKCPFPQMDSIFVKFPDLYEHGYSGMQIGHVTSPPTFVKELVVDDAHLKYNGVRRTSHLNLVNLMDMLVTEDGVYLSYEGTGDSLVELRSFISGDPIAVATICKKVPMTHVPLWDVITD